MREQLPFYPFKITSRSLTPTRTNKLRLSWFIMGTAFGIACALAANERLPSFMAPTPLVEVVEKPNTAAVDAALNAAFNNETPPAPNGPTIYPLTLTLKVEDGDTFIDMLTDTGVSSEEAHNAVRAIGKEYNLKRLDVGQSITVELDKSEKDSGKPIIKSIGLPISPAASLEMVRTKDNGFAVKKTQAPVTRKLKRAKASIEGSLYETGINQGLPPALLAELITAYSYDVDFQRDIKRGDKLDVLYDRMETDEGIPAGYGNVLFAELGLGDRTLKIYRYVDKSGRADYYNAKGESVRKALLRTPINGAKITSGFGLRSHPILGYSRMHRGVDFGAPIGTPIYAAGDGTVNYVGRKGAYGNYLRIKHTAKYATAYAHVSRFAKNVKMGGKVKQGQIVAYVGTTGMSTGPHLHYEVLVGSDQVNPAKMKFKTGNVLTGKELANFRKTIEQLEAQLSNTSAGQMNMAMVSDSTPSTAR